MASCHLQMDGVMPSISPAPSLWHRTAVSPHLALQLSAEAQPLVSQDAGRVLGHFHVSDLHHHCLGSRVTSVISCHLQRSQES